jgi:cytochrome c oxidase subunit IV
MEHGHHPSPNYFGVFLILGALTLIEIAVSAPFLVHIVPQVPALLGLAIAKAVLVVLYYMHLKFDSRLYSAIFVLGLFLGLIFMFAILIR